ncbi:MAG: dihydroorotase [Candidatus Pacebacteria bacterium]|nr:dihydroorotase [Candidatus Paceibacterota bacterium]
MLSIEGIIVTETGEMRRRVLIENGVITKVAEPIGEADVILGDELIFPGFVDVHVHCREDVSHKNDYKEDFTTGGEAAINGGVVAFMEMPNCPVPPVDDATFDARNALTEKSPVTIALYAGIGPTTRPLSKKVPYKAFMGHSIGDLFFNSREELEQALEHYKGESVSFHCEDPEIMDEHVDGETHEQRRPESAEWSAVDTAIELIEKYSLKGKVCHISTKEGVDKIVTAKKRGVNVTTEVTPHHLYFDETMITDESRVRFQVNPPIRQTKENRLALIEALKRGDIDYLATDHAPHTIEEKEKGISGLTHLDTYGPFTTWLMKEHGFSSEDIERVASRNPGAFMSEFQTDRYGKIEEGYIGSLTIIDMNRPKVVRSEDLKTKCRWSPFEGVEFPGSVTMTIVKGKIYAK